MLDQLPGDIYLRIADYLSPGEAALFSLTCRRAYETATEKRPVLLTRMRCCIDKQERLAFLGFLEKDNANLILC
jgi:hypothetical protein